MMSARAPEKGSVREVLVIALPMVVSYACDTIMIFTDRLFLARLGPVLMNAALAGGISNFMMMGFVFGLVGYTTALAAQYLGAGRKEKCALVTTQAFLMILAAYPVLLACRPLVHLFFEFMNVPSVQLGPQKEYFDILLYGVIAGLSRHALASFFSGIGKTRIVMIASFAAMLVNVVLDYVLIYGKFGFPALGIRGAAYASITGSLCGTAVLAWRYLGTKAAEEYGVRKSFRFNREVAAKLWRFGSPAGLEMFLNIFAFNLMVLLFHATGLVGATAASVVFNWDLVSFVPLLGVEVGVTSLVGRYMGAGDPALAHRSTMSGMKFGSCYSAVLFVLFVFFPEMLVEVFRPEGDEALFRQSVGLAVFMLRFASLYVFLQAVVITLIGALRGAGDTVWAMWMTVGTHWAIAGVLYLMLHVFRFPAEAGWLMLIGVFFVFSGIVYLRYRGGRWKKIHVIDHPAGEREIPAAPL